MDINRDYAGFREIIYRNIKMTRTIGKGEKAAIAFMIAAGIGAVGSAGYALKRITDSVEENAVGPSIRHVTGLVHHQLQLSQDSCAHTRAPSMTEIENAAVSQQAELEQALERGDPIIKFKVKNDFVDVSRHDIDQTVERAQVVRDGWDKTLKTMGLACLVVSGFTYRNIRKSLKENQAQPPAQDFN
jgi:hypothetical protein